MMILSQLSVGGKDLGGEAMRVAAGVITGVGFLGAGAIIQSRGAVHGLTTASTIWAVAGLGSSWGRVFTSWPQSSPPSSLSLLSSSASSSSISLEKMGRDLHPDPER